MLTLDANRLKYTTRNSIIVGKSVWWLIFIVYHGNSMYNIELIMIAGNKSIVASSAKIFVFYFSGYFGLLLLQILIF